MKAVCRSDSSIIRRRLVSKSPTIYIWITLYTSISYGDSILESNRRFGRLLFRANLESTLESNRQRIAGNSLYLSFLLAFLIFLIVPDRHFPAVPATLHAHAINSVPVHRFHQGKVLFLMATAENTPEMRRQSVRCITIHSLRNHQRHCEPFSGDKT